MIRGPGGVLSAQRGAVDSDAVLESLRVLRQEEVVREQSLVLLAVQWAVVNARPRPQGEAGDELDGLWADLARGGAPHVDHLTLPLFASASGQTEFQAVRLMSEALALVYFLPRVWQGTSQGQIEVWRARALAAACHGLTREALDFVDLEMSRTTARHTKGGREAVITRAKLEHMPEQIREQEECAGKRRQVMFDFSNASSGTVDVCATLDVLDARALMAAVNAHATYLGEHSEAA